MNNWYFTSLKGLLCIVLCNFSLSVNTVFAQASTYEEQLPKIATDLLNKISTLQNAQIGIVNFADKKQQTNALGEFLAEEFTSSLADQPSSLRFIDKERVHFFLSKEKLSLKDLANPTTANRLAKKTGISHLITGKMLQVGNLIRLTVKVMNLKSGQIVATSKGTILSSPIINELLNESKPLAEPTTTPSKPIPSKPKEVLTMKGVALASTDEKTSEEIIYFDEYLALPMVKEINNLEFKLEKVKRAGHNIICFFTITNKSGDVKIKVDKYTRIYNASGRFYAAGAYQFNNDQQGGYLTKILTTGVPVKAQFIFKDVPPTLTKITKLEVPYYAGRKEQFELFNVPIE